MGFTETELDIEDNNCKEEKQVRQGAVKADIYYHYFKEGLGLFLTVCLFFGIVLVQVSLPMSHSQF